MLRESAAVVAAVLKLSWLAAVLQMGIVGMPNVGKSTLFNVLTKMGIPAENFPFCTIEPNQVLAAAQAAW